MTPQLAQEIAHKVVLGAESLFGRGLTKPLSYHFKTEGTEDRKRWPAGWDPGTHSHVLGMFLDFDLAHSWWLMEERAKIIMTF